MIIMVTQSEWEQICKDEEIKYNNLKSGLILCKNCDGTGSEWYSIYRRCLKCSGSGQNATQTD